MTLADQDPNGFLFCTWLDIPAAKGRHSSAYVVGHAITHIYIAAAIRGLADTILFRDLMVESMKKNKTKKEDKPFSKRRKAVKPLTYRVLTLQHLRKARLLNDTRHTPLSCYIDTHFDINEMLAVYTSNVSYKDDVRISDLLCKILGNIGIRDSDYLATLNGCQSIEILVVLCFSFTTGT